MRRTTTGARIPIETNEKAKQLAREISAIQNKDIPVHEVIRRAFNIPDIDTILKIDAENKRRMK